MSFNVADWSTLADYPPSFQQGATTSDEVGDGAETSTAPHPEPSPWTWGLPQGSTPSYGMNDAGPLAGASGGDFPPTQFDNLPPPSEHNLEPFSFATVGSSSYLSTESTPQAASSGSDNASGNGGNGISLSMLEAGADLLGGSGQQYRDGRPTSVDPAIRRGTMDSGLASSASHSRKHSRPRSAGVEQEAPISHGEAVGSGSGAESSRRRVSEQSDGGRSGSGSGNGDFFAGQAAGGSNGKLVKRSDKSCKKCRERRVRCDRHWPTCDRCQKRRENCEWAETNRVEDVEEGGDVERIADLTAKVAALERQLKSHPTTDNNLPPSAPARLSSRNSSSTPPSGFNLGSDNSLASISSTMQLVWGANMRLSPQEHETLRAFLMGHAVSNAQVGRGSVAWQLGEKGLVFALTRHLLDAASAACCSKLPGIAPLAGRIEHFKVNIDTLTPQERCHVAVLCALGARASPHSQLLGIETALLQTGGPSPPLYLYAGERREMACRHLEARARELCWQHGLVSEASLANLDALVGLTQLLIFEYQIPAGDLTYPDEEILPSQSRFFLRNGVAMYSDIRHGAMDKGERTSQNPRDGPGAALFLADAMIAAACYRPSYITTNELDTLYLSDGVPVPDFPGSSLRDELNGLLQPPLTKSSLSSALTTTSMWVCGCARLFAQLTTGRRPGAGSTLPLLKNLWTLIDKVHNAVQELQQLLVSLTVAQVSGCEDEPYGIEHFVLLGVRFDALLVDLINLMHGYLLRNRNGPGVWSEREDDPLLATMRAESELRVRKCLKLSSFYAQLYLQSQDKHLVHHMLMQLEMLPEWTTFAAQRVGSPNGPLSKEYELTENELDWFQQALELSSYYTPKASDRLMKMAEARQEYTKRFDSVPDLHTLLRNAPDPTGPLPTVDHLNAQRAAYESHRPSAAMYHYDLPPHNLSSLGPLQPPSDPAQLYQFDASSVPDPSQLYVFDTFGVAASQGVPLSSLPSVQDLAFVQHNFHGQNWMDGSALSHPSAPDQQPHREEEARITVPQLGSVPITEPAGPGNGTEWMRGGGRGGNA